MLLLWWALGAILILAPRLLLALRAILLQRAILLLRELLVAVLTLVAVHFIAIIAVVEIFAARPALLVEARLALAQNPKIMFGKLQEIFGLDAVASLLAVACQSLVFLQQLRRIATLASILTIAI